MLKIVTVPSDVLRQVSKPVMTVDAKLLSLLESMKNVLMTAKNPQGVGLAAPQVGVSLRVFMIRPKTDGPITTMINPEILRFSQKLTDPGKKNGTYEGCLSIPQHYSPVVRSYSVTVKYQSLNRSISNTTNRHDLALDIEGLKLIEKTEVFSGFAAHVIQHEMDHLNGILFIDRSLAQNIKIYKIEGKDWKEVGI